MQDAETATNTYERNSAMSSFVVYYTPTTGPGSFLTGNREEGFGGTYRLSEATKFKTKVVAEEVASNYGAIGSECTVLKWTGESF